MEKVILCILDGWGISKQKKYNAISLAKIPFLDLIYTKCNTAELNASGPAVGLEEGQVGNSEVGHITIGAGRAIPQSLTKINNAISSGLLEEKIISFIKKVKDSGKVCHIFCLISDGGVHSHIEHLKYICTLFKYHKAQICIHAILDGRDTSPKSAKRYLLDLQENIKQSPSTISGRYFAMDRDKRWERTREYYIAVVNGFAPSFFDVENFIDQQYDAETVDEFIQPHIASGYNGIQDGDFIFMCNFRADRVRQLLSSILDPDFQEFERIMTPKIASACGMISYSKNLDQFIPSLFKECNIQDTLGSIISSSGLTQLRIAETEKYAHVTYFFNGGREEAFQGEQRIMIASPNVDKYDKTPEMSSREITNVVISNLETQKFNFICVNFAAADMIGHTGNIDAAKLACSIIDDCLKKIYDASVKNGYNLIITADHGNAEEMFNQQFNQKHTSHTKNKVPFICISHEDRLYSVNSQSKFRCKKFGELADITPTILDIMNIAKPDIMSGSSLLLKI